MHRSKSFSSTGYGKEYLKKAKENEESKLGCQILEQLDENLKIAAEDMIPICQDTGMAVVLLK